MILKFTKDYIGRETAMQAYTAGQQVEIPNAQALELIRLGVAKDVWAEVGKMYDPPAKVEPAAELEPPAVVKAGDAYLTSGKSPKIIKPRKGKVKK
jgi:hypothetical protein